MSICKLFLCHPASGKKKTKKPNYSPVHTATTRRTHSTSLVCAEVGLLIEELCVKQCRGDISRAQGHDDPDEYAYLQHSMLLVPAVGRQPALASFPPNNNTSQSRETIGVVTLSIPFVGLVLVVNIPFHVVHGDCPTLLSQKDMSHLLHTEQRRAITSHER